jgi:hypothetical protein
VEIRGIINKPFSNNRTVDFYDGDSLIANLKLGLKEQLPDIYKLVLIPSNEKGISEISISVRGALSRIFLIQIPGQEMAWIYKRKNWLDFFYRKKTLITNHEEFELIKSIHNIRVVKNGRVIGTAQKVFIYSLQFGEYNISFESREYLLLFLIVASIHVIDKEVMEIRDKNLT